MARQVKPLLVIVGETASGKSELAMKLAKQFKGEIICGDAWTLRREANIGTAKPSLSDREAVKHHLVDIIDPDESFSAAKFKKLANEAIDDISSRHRLPILVGGTGLYIYSLLYDYSFLPNNSNQSLRDELNGLSLYDLNKRAKSMGLDLNGVDASNSRRLIRLIETRGVKPEKSKLRPGTLIIGLKTDKEVLEKRITSRVDFMLEAGLEAEVKTLSQKYGWQAEALKGINYWQWHDYFNAQDDLENVRQKLIKANLNLAKRQRTWFKKNKSIHWISTPVNWTHLVDLITTKLIN